MSNERHLGVRAAAHCRLYSRKILMYSTFQLNGLSMVFVRPFPRKYDSSVSFTAIGVIRGIEVDCGAVALLMWLHSMSLFVYCRGPTLTLGVYLEGGK